MLKVIFLMAVLTAVASGESCQKVVCGNPPGHATCASYRLSENTWTIKPCASSERCDTSLLSHISTTARCVAYTSPVAPIPQKQIAGHTCVDDDGCFSGVCENNICRGITNSTSPCVTIFSASDEEKAMICGANRYCSLTTNRCVFGGSLDDSCSVSTPCALPNLCNQGKCTAPGSVPRGGLCDHENSVCQDNLYCSAAATCELMEVHTAGSFLGLCFEDSDCAPSTCECAGANTMGLGRCGPVSPFYSSRAFVNAVRESAANETASLCPIRNNDACALSINYPVRQLPLGDCYGFFRFGTSNSTAVFLAFSEEDAVREGSGLLNSIMSYISNLI